MSLLKSYSFGAYKGFDNLPSSVLGLFEDLVENKEMKIKYASEIIYNALNGRVDFSRKFNIGAYEAKIDHNANLNKSKKGKKEYFLDYSTGSDSESDFAATRRKGGIVLENANDRALIEINDAYETLADEDELRYAVQSIKAIQKDLFIEKQVDFIGLIQEALNRVPYAIQTVKDICEEYPLVSEQVSIILNSGNSFEECFSL